jgi:uncharacterized membrane protein HdeD (DUF308 family)
MPFGGLFHHGLHEVRRNWGWFLVLGIGLVVMGTLALAASCFTTLVTVIFIGWFIFADGILQILLAFQSRYWSGVFLNLLAGILAIIVGFLLVSHPLRAAEALTLLLAAFFLVGGFFEFFGGLVMRFPSWLWVVLGGLVNIVLGMIIWNNWPESSLWIIGMFVGINMIFRGWSFVMFALAVRRLPAGGPTVGV